VHWSSSRHHTLVTNCKQPSATGIVNSGTSLPTASSKYTHTNDYYHSPQWQQEAQLLLGDRATRKHAKDCWNGRGNDNLGRNDLQMYFKVIKSGTNRKLVYDFLLAVSNFCRITHRFWEIWCETVQWPWNMPNVIDSRITWKLSCGHVCKMFGRQWTNEAKIAIFNDPFSFDPPLRRTPTNICINLILPETTFLGLHFCRWQYMGSAASFRTVLSESRRHQPISCWAWYRF